MKKNKIAYLILVHNNFNHLDRLIKTLDDGYADFFVHIDKKTKEVYQPTGTNVYILPNRTSIFWGGIGMIYATLDLLNYSLSKSDADHFILISGVDYPIRNQAFLYDKLSENKQFINLAKAPTKSKSLDRFEFFHFNFDRRNKLSKLFFRPIEIVIAKLGLKRKLPSGIVLYVGSQWFALTKECVEYICDYIKKNPDYLEFFKHVYIPDESFFQTIVGNSPFKKNVVQSLIYTDWNCKNPPAIISDKHIKILKDNVTFNTEYGITEPFFARKFNDGSANILDKIDSELRE